MWQIRGSRGKWEWEDWHLLGGWLVGALSTMVCLSLVTARHWSALTSSIYWTVNGRTMTSHSSQTSNCQSSSYTLQSVSSISPFPPSRPFYAEGVGIKRSVELAAWLLIVAAHRVLLFRAGDNAGEGRETGDVWTRGWNDAALRTPDGLPWKVEGSSQSRSSLGGNRWHKGGWVQQLLRCPCSITTSIVHFGVFLWGVCRQWPLCLTCTGCGCMYTLHVQGVGVCTPYMYRVWVYVHPTCTGCGVCTSYMYRVWVYVHPTCTGCGCMYTLHVQGVGVCTSYAVVSYPDQDYRSLVLCLHFWSGDETTYPWNWWQKAKFVASSSIFGLYLVYICSCVF